MIYLDYNILLNNFQGYTTHQLSIFLEPEIHSNHFNPTSIIYKLAIKSIPVIDK